MVNSGKFILNCHTFAKSQGRYVSELFLQQLFIGSPLKAKAKQIIKAKVVGITENIKLAFLKWFNFLFTRTPQRTWQI